MRGDWCRLLIAYIADHFWAGLYCCLWNTGYKEITVPYFGDGGGSLSPMRLIFLCHHFVTCHSVCLLCSETIFFDNTIPVTVVHCSVMWELLTLVTEGTTPKHTSKMIIDHISRLWLVALVNNSRLETGRYW